MAYPTPPQTAPRSTFLSAQGPGVPPPASGIPLPVPGMYPPPGLLMTPLDFENMQHKITPVEEQEAAKEPPPENTYPCGCPYPGDHKPDCMWSLWEQMRDNYLKTKKLMSKFMNQAISLQSDGTKPQCECPPGCHGRDLGEAMGLQQMQGVTVPWQQSLPGTQMGAVTPAIGYPESRQMMEEQQRIKKTWVQFLNIFDMSLDLANDVSKDRWEANKRRKERARLERQERLEEQRRQRQERSSTMSSSETSDEKAGKKDKRLPKQEVKEKPKASLKKGAQPSISEDESLNQETNEPNAEDGEEVNEPEPGNIDPTEPMNTNVQELQIKEEPDSA